MSKAIFYNFISIVGSLFWGLSGLITIVSLKNDIRYNNVFSNIFVGILFMVIGWFFYLKSRNCLQVYNGLRDSNCDNTVDFDKFINLEIIVMIIYFLISTVALSAVFSRCFLEKFTVFG